MRIGIVNDLQLAVVALRRVLGQAEDCEVAWVAHDGAQALERCRADRPDLVLMDLVMPVMDGVEATHRIMQDAPCPILVVTATVDGHMAKVYDALGAGALDAVDGPTLGVDGSVGNAEPILRKIRTIRRLHGRPAPAAGPPAAAGTRGPRGGPPLIAIGASTGGPDALVRLLAALDPDLEAPIVVVQHLDARFVPGFVTWLAGQTHRRIAAVTGPQAPEPGTVLVAAGDDHLVLGPDGLLRYQRTPEELAYRPSVDVFFASLASLWPALGVAVVLTGMGRDGAEGLRHLRDRGWTTFAQDEATSVVYGMPRAAKEAGAAQHVLPIDAMGARVASAWRQLARGPSAGRRTG